MINNILFINFKMLDKDILSDFFNDLFKNKNRKNKSNYLKKYNISLTQNNFLKFTPRTIKRPSRLSINITPYNFYEKRLFHNKKITNEIFNNKAKKKYSLKDTINSFNESLNLNSKQNNNNKQLDIITINNNTNYQNKTSSTYFNSTSINKKGRIINKNNEEIKKLLPTNLENKIKNKSNIGEKAIKIIDYYLNTDLSKIKKNEKIESEKVNKVKKNIKCKLLLDKKLLKMSNIRHKLMAGQYSDFKSISLQRKSLGKEKYRKNLLKSIEDYYSNQTYRGINEYIIENKEKNRFIENEKITNEFEFYNNKVKYPLSERIQRIKKNRIDQKLKGFYSFNKNKSKIKKIEYMNFYERMNYISDRAKTTYDEIQKRIDIRKKLKDNLDSIEFMK